MRNCSGKKEKVVAPLDAGVSFNEVRRRVDGGRVKSVPFTNGQAHGISQCRPKPFYSIAEKLFKLLIGPWLQRKGIPRIGLRFAGGFPNLTGLIEIEELRYCGRQVRNKGRSIVVASSLFDASAGWFDCRSRHTASVPLAT